MNLITAVWSQRVLAMPMSLVLIGRVERGDSAYWLARVVGGAFDSLARTSSTRQSLVRETTSFMYRQKLHRNCKPRAYVTFRRPFFSFFPSCVGLLFVNTVIDSSGSVFYPIVYIGFVNRRTRVKFATPLFFSSSQVNDVTLRIFRPPPGVVTCFYCD